MSEFIHQNTLPSVEATAFNVLAYAQNNPRTLMNVRQNKTTYLAKNKRKQQQL